MLDICLLGSGGMMPLPKRFLTSMMARINGQSILVDCGEGTQIALRKKGWSPNPIDIICFTHFHADHISGLPGMLLTMGNAERTKPLLLIGPKGLTRTVNALRVIAPGLPFEIECREIEEDEQIFPFDGFEIKAFKVNHSITCYGYSLCINRLGKFDVDKAKANGIDIKYWNRLQHGESVVTESGTYTPDMVVGSARKGLKVTYCTDTRPCDRIVTNADDADLFICEGMYGEDDMADNAKGYKHMTFREAATLASKAGVKRMWLTHFSPSLTRPGDFIHVAKRVFEDTELGSDGKTITLRFEDEE